MDIRKLKYLFKINYAKRQYQKKDGKGSLLFAKHISKKTKRRLCKNKNAYLTFDYLNPVKQCTHPDIIKSSLFNKYLLTVSGYPFEIAKFENPFLYSSENGTDFINVFGDKPIATYMGDGASHYSDSEIIEDNGKVYLFYRMCYEDCDVPNIKIIVRSSDDLIRWSDEYELFSKNGKSYLSPAFVKRDNKYHMYYVDLDDEKNAIYNLKRKVSNSLLFDDEPKEEVLKLNNCPQNRSIWHIDVISDGDVLRGLFVFMIGKKAEGGTRLYYAESKDDGKTWDIGDEIMFDINYKLVKRIYRSTMIKGENGWDIYYPVCTKNDCWYLLLSKNRKLGLK